MYDLITLSHINYILIKMDIFREPGNNISTFHLSML